MENLKTTQEEWVSDGAVAFILNSYGPRPYLYEAQDTLVRRASEWEKLNTLVGGAELALRLRIELEKCG